MRRWTAVVLFLVMGCSGDVTTVSTTSAPPATPATVGSTTIPSTTIASTTPTTGPSQESSGRIPELDRSFLGLALDPGDTRPGRFRLERGPNTEILMTVEGRYWVTDEGNVYTTLDLDRDLVAEQMRFLADIFEAAGGERAGAPYLVSIREHYRGNEFQIGLTDLVRWLAIGGLPAEWAEQWSWFTQTDEGAIPEELEACRVAITSLDRAARRWVLDLEIVFSDGTWVFPVETFETALSTEIEQASICEEFVDLPGPTPEIVIGLSGEPDNRRIEVLVDEKVYTDREPESIFTIEMWPGESVGPPPDDPDPASLLTLRGSFLAAIGACGELPWIYSNFAASDTYYGPESVGYPGPVVFASGWYCEDEVPQNRRNDGG